MIYMYAPTSTTRAPRPFLGWALAGLGAFFVRRGGGSVQPDPALRAKVGVPFKGSIGAPLRDL